MPVHSHDSGRKRLGAHQASFAHGLVRLRQALGACLDNSGLWWLARIGFCLLMSKTFRPWTIDQPLLLPPSVQDFVGEDHLARFILALVLEPLDLGEIEAAYASERGQPPFDPAMMTALLLYGYCNGVYSSRRIAKAARERVDFLSIVGLDPPDFRTVSDFRKRHLKALAGLFGQVLKLCESGRGGQGQSAGRGAATSRGPQETGQARRPAPAGLRILRCRRHSRLPRTGIVLERGRDRRRRLVIGGWARDRRWRRQRQGRSVGRRLESP